LTRAINKFTWLMILFIAVMVPDRLSAQRAEQTQLDGSISVCYGRGSRADPEMLPMIVTVNLSKGALAMRAKK